VIVVVRKGSIGKSMGDVGIFIGIVGGFVGIYKVMTSSGPQESFPHFPHLHFFG